MVAGEFEGSDPNDMIGYLRRRHLWKGWELPPKGWTEKHRSRKSDGTVHTYGTNPLNVEVPMAHGSRAFHDYKWTWAVERFGEEVGLDGIYWDSNSHGSPSWNTNDRYDNDPGLTAVGTIETQHAINQAYAKLHAGGYVTMGEGSPCAAMQAVRHIHLANCYSIYPNRMLLPQMILVPGGANGQDVEMHKTFLAGARMYGVKYYQEHKPLQQAMIWMRKRVKQYLYPADYRDTLGLTVSNPSVQARVLICDPTRTRGAVLNILNLTRVEGAHIDVDASLFGPIEYAWLIDSERKDAADAPPTPIDGKHTYRVRVPEAEASHILLFSTAEPRITATIDGELAAGSSVPVKVRVESLTREPVRGALSLVPPAGLSARSATFDTESVQDVVLELAAEIDAANDIIDVPVAITVKGGPAFERVVTLFVHEPVTWRLEWIAPGAARLRLHNLCAAHFPSVGGDIGVERHILRFEWRDPDSVLEQDSA